MLSFCCARLSENQDINPNQLRKSLSLYCEQCGIDNIVFKDVEQESEEPVFGILVEKLNEQVEELGQEQLKLFFEVEVKESGERLFTISEFQEKLKVIDFSLYNNEIECLFRSLDTQKKGRINGQSIFNLFRIVEKKVKKEIVIENNQRVSNLDSLMNMISVQLNKY